MAMTVKLVRAAGAPRAGEAAGPRSARLRERAAFWDGVLASVPLWLYIAPFGLAFALAARAAGLSAAETIGMSILVNAGTSQFTAVGLLAGPCRSPWRHWWSTCATSLSPRHWRRSWPT